MSDKRHELPEFFDQDSDGHWYKIPSSLRKKWNKMTENDIDYDDYKAQARFESSFGDYRIDGDPSSYDVYGATRADD